MERIRLILGTMTFGSQADAAETKKMIQLFLDSGQMELDTAYVYNSGETEKLLGRLLSKEKKRIFRVATKAHPEVTGKLDGAAVRLQLDESLKRLKRDKVDLFYLHMPDRVTPIEESLSACAELHAVGKFDQLGLSNYPSWMVVKACQICRQNGWPVPAVYQGMYNALSRKPEGELFPALRDQGVRFNVYNPLAGGLLTGKYSSYNSKPTDGRFAALTFYQDRYWKKSLFKAVENLTNECWAEGTSPVSAALRWIAFHSHLDFEQGDGIILGATSVQQLEQNLSAFEEGPLPEKIVEAYQQAWEEGRTESPEYFRFYPE